MSAPVIQNAITNGDVQITGGGPDGFSKSDAASLVAIMGSGPLPFPITATSSSTIDLPSPGSSKSVSSPGPSRLHLEFAPAAPGPMTADLMDKVVGKLQARIADAGVVDATVDAQGADRIIVELPGVTSADDPLVDMLPRTGHVNLVELRDGQVSIDLPIDPAGHPPVLPEDAVDSVTEDVDQSGVAVFAFELSPDAAAPFAGYAAAHAGSTYAIAIDGDVLLAPVTLRDFTDGVLTVTADGTVVDRSNARVRAILAVLQTGPLPFDLKAVSTEVVPEPTPCAPSARCAAPSPAGSTP